MLAPHVFHSIRHKTFYWEAGPANGPLMIFLHGWPGIGLMWRAQMEAFAVRGWRCIAPDMRGYGNSSAPVGIGAYAVEEIVQDMVELHDHLGSKAAIWVGHDWGSPIAAQLSANHDDRSRGGVLMSVAYFPEGFGLPSLIPLVNRDIYPEGEYPDGQWDYFRYYQTNFEDTVADLDADIRASLASIYRAGNSAAIGQVSPSARVTRNGGRYGAAHRAPPAEPDAALWPPDDFESLVEGFKAHGFRSPNAWYLNDTANAVYARTAPNHGTLAQPVLFVIGEWDAICGISNNRLGDPMRAACPALSIATLPGGHWLPNECKNQSIAAIQTWLQSSAM